MAGREADQAEVSAGSAGMDAGTAPAAREELQILLVDDRPENLRALEAVLSPLGLPLISATSGSRALRLLLEHDFAVILLDVRMPVMDGLETARLIKSRERTRDIPIIFMTAARDEVRDVVRGYEAGAADYVLKPFDPDLLRSKVSIFVELQESRRALQASEGLLRGAFDSSPTGMTVIDDALRIVRANPMFARMLGLTIAELESAGVAELCHPNDREELLISLQRVLDDSPGPGGASGGEATGFDVRLRTAGGSELWAAAIATAIEPSHHLRALLLVQWVDLSVRRRAEEARAELLLEHSARTQAEAAAERLGKLQTLTDALGSLSLERLLGELVVRMAELFAVDAAEVRVGGETETVVRAVGGQIVSDLDGASPSEGSWVREPMRLERLGVGEVGLHLDAGRALTAAEQSLLQEAADRAALAIEQSLLFEEEHRIAAELQRGLLPKELPRVAGLELGAHYEAAGVAAKVGGDWYDVFALAGERLGLVVGDVAGRGIPAASMMGQLRAVTRALAIQNGERRLPGEVLTRLNRYQLALDEQQYVTVVYVIVDPGRGAVTWANAGHLPPLLHAGPETMHFLSGGGYPLGTEDIEYASLSDTFGIGSALMLYTDGLVERRGEPIDDGLARLARAVDGAPHGPEEMCEHVLRELVGGPAQTADDVTAVVVRRT